MSKKIFAFIMALLLIALTGCNATVGGGDSGGDAPTGRGDYYCYKGVVKSVGNKQLTAEIIDSDIAFGDYIVLVNSGTTYEHQDGSAASFSDIKVGDTILIHFSGQVMLSYPPQIAAQRIVLP